MSRPSSAVAYSCANHLPPVVYTGPPAPEQGMSALSHPEAMEYFTVCLLASNAHFVLIRVQDHCWRPGESCRSVPHYFSLGTPLEPRYSLLDPPGALHRRSVG